MKKKFYKRPWVIVSAVILIIIIYFGFLRHKAPVYSTVIVQRGNVIQEVSVTGMVKPAENVDLAFEKSGKISYVNVQVGDMVTAGETLVTQSNADISAQLDQAKASVLEEQAKLDDLKNGTRPEEIQLEQVKVDNAQADLLQKIQDAYTVSDDAVRNKADELFSNPRSSNPQLTSYLNADSVSKSDIEWRRLVLEGELNSWKSSLSDPALAENNLNDVKTFLDKLSLIVNVATANSNISQTTLDGWKTDISAARTNVGAALTNLTGSESSLAVEKNNLALEKAGSTAEQIREQEAAVEAAQASVKNYEAQLAKTILAAPIGGVVTREDAKAGEIAEANTVLVSIISESKYQVEANVPEADIAKVKVGDAAQITLDAYGNDVIFDASVIKIDPGETEIEGVATYKTTFEFLKEDERVKTGMTANIDIMTDRRDNVLVIPQRAVTSSDDTKSVEILENGKIKQANITVGLRGSDGNYEVVNGLNEGDKVINSNTP
jgi:HlyD family secretion protein